MQKSFQCRNGKTVALFFDEEDTLAVATDNAGNKIGEFRFAEKEDGLSHTYLKLVWAHLEDIQGYIRQGIGRELIKLAKEATGLTIDAEINDGIRKEDGSHLTGDAPAFIFQMRKEGLIARATGDGLPERESSDDL
ncbi:MAG: hypothetical protein KIT48_08340 [Pseudolabrys sp.]|nr:hypothetical protein [Pseudolabrys sp.]